MANLHLVTGHAGEPHVKSTDDASLMQAIYGGDSVVLDRNNAFAYDVISNNIIRVYDGEALMQGRYIKMDKGNYVNLNIDNGHTGYKRIDVIAIEYTKNDETNIEEANLVVVKGSETQQEEATVPELIDGDTVDGSASTNQMALYHVKIDGLSITDVEQAFTLGQDFQLASGQINTIGAVAHRLVNVAKKGLDVFKQLSYDDEADVQTRTDYESLVNGLDDAGSYVFPPTQNGDGGVTPDANAINRLNTRLTSELTTRADADTRLEGLIDDERTAREQLDTDVRSLIQSEVNDRVSGDNNLQHNIDELGNTVRSKYSDCMSRMNNLEGGISVNTSTISGLRSAIENEKKERQDADGYIIENTDTFIRNEFEVRDERNNVVNVFPTSSDAEKVYPIETEYDAEMYTGGRTKNDIFVVLNDSTHNGDKTYYRYEGNKSTLIAFESAKHTNAEIDTLLNAKQDKLSESQLATVNSGLTSSDKTTLDGLDSRVTANENDIDDINDTVELLYKTLKKDNSWTELASLVRSGKASKFLGYGDQIEEDWIDVDNNNKEYSNPWDVAKFEDVETREGTIHGMFLKTHWATLRPIQFSHNRAFYACRDGLSAGTYHITLGADWGTNAKKDKSYQFTIANDVPEGGKLAGLYSMPDVVPTNWKVYVYDANGIDILENAIAVTEGTDGTSLGTLKLNTRDGNLNSMQETAYGNNDWEISAYRQYLNSREGKGAWWIAQDEWDIAPDQLNTVSGFLCGISDELYNAMRTVKVKTWKNNPTYGGVESYTYDKVFLPSKEELYYIPQKAGEGTYYPLMKEQLGLDGPLADYTAYAPNITYAIENHSSAQYVRLRSASLNIASLVWYAYTSGSVSGYGIAAFAYRCTPVCVIG